MTLQGRLLLGISVMFFALLLGVETIYLANTRAQTEQQLTSGAQNAATAISLRLAALPDLGDRALVETLLGPVFDRGFYREIRVLSPAGETVAQRVLPPGDDGVPIWFKDLFPLNPPGAQSLVSSGWRETGRVLVLSHPNFAYQQLWRAGTQTAAWLALMYALAFGAAMLFISNLLKPLRAMERTAEAIGHRDFRTIDEIPAARELASVVGAMNLMSGRIRRIVEHEATRAEELRREAFIDPLTGLYNRRGFKHQLRSLLKSVGEATAAGLAIVEFEKFGEFNTRVGYQRGDEVLALLARTVAESFVSEGAVCGRLGGASFAVGVVLGGEAGSGAGLMNRLCHNLNNALAEQGLQSDLKFHAGATRSDGELPSFAALLAAADHALERARAKGDGEYEIELFDAASEAGSQVWRARIEAALAEDRIVLYAQAALGLPARVPVHAEVTVRMLGEDGQPVPAAQFLPMAVRHGLIGRLDLRVAEKLLEHLAVRPAGGIMAMNVSARTAADPQASAQLLALLETRRTLAPRLVIEMTEFGALQDAAHVQRFSEAVRRLGAGFALDNFGMRQESLMLVHALKPGYIKLAPGYTRDLRESADTRFFVAALVRATQPLDIGIFAQAVEDESLLPLLQELGVAGYQGYAAALPARLAP